MKNKFVFLTFILVFSIASLQSGMAQDNSSTNPAAVAAPVRSMIELGSVYTNIYDITITVLETVRGKEAMTRLENAGERKAPAEGFEYVLARVKFQFKGRAVSDKIPFDLGTAPLQWIALAGKDLTEYPHVSLKLPQPVLVGTIQPGASAEGWVGFAVDKNDAKPVMVFDPDTGGATGRGKTVFFKLYQ